MKKMIGFVEMFLFFPYNLSMAFKNAIKFQSAKRCGKIGRGPLILLFLIIHTCLFSQNENIRFKHVEGNYQSTAHCILQDKRGFMWFGTRDGLARYDGYNFKVYKPDREYPEYSISDSLILSIFEASDGMLWVGTKNGGLNKFDPETERFTHYALEPRYNETLMHDEINCILEDRGGVIWIGTNGNGLNMLLNKEKRIFKDYKHDKKNPNSLSNDSVTSIIEDSDGFLWIGTDGGGLNKFDKKTGKFTRFKHSYKPNSLSNDNVTSIMEDKESLWIGTDGGGLNKFDKKTKEFIAFTHRDNDVKSLSHDNVNCIYKDWSGVLWIGTDDGINKVEQKNGQVEFTAYTHYNIFSIYEDRSGILWIGTYGKDIFKRESSFFALHRIDITDQSSNSNIKNDITSFCEHRQGSLLIGTNGGGIYEFDRKKGSFKPYKPDGLLDKSKLENLERIKSIFMDSSDALWIGTLDNGLNMISPDRKNFKPYKYNPGDSKSLSNNEVRTIYQDKEGKLWVGTKNGLNMLTDRKEGHFERNFHDHKDPESLSDNSVYIIYEDRSGVLWIGTDTGGLNRFNREKKNREKNVFTSFINRKGDNCSLSHNFVLCIFEDRAGTLWVGTYGGGLNKMSDRENGKFESYQKEEGLPDDKIYGILEDKAGNLWLSTNNGLSRFNPKTKEIKNYSVEDGLQHNEFNGGAYHKCKDGEMFFGGINGFNDFFPENTADDFHLPPVVITDFLMDNKSVPLQWREKQSPLEKKIYATDALTLSHSQNAFAFEFAALHFANPQKNMYRYQLEGYDKDWVEANSGNRRAIYTNMSAGNYVFRVQGSNKDGKWNEDDTSIKLKILPSPWLTWWAFTIYIFALVSVVYLALSLWDQRKKLAYERKMAQQLRDYQEQLIQAEKMASLGVLLAGVAHELKNPAGTIMLNSEFLSKAWKDIVPVLDQSFKSKQNFKIAGLPYIESKKEMNQLITDLLDSSHRIKKITEEVKDYARKEDAMTKNEVDVNKIIPSAISLTKKMIEKSTKHFSHKLDDDLPNIYGNYQRLQQVFINLIQNACQALPDDNHGIHISSNYDEKKNEIVVKVQDEGKGIEKKDLKNITDPFFTTKRAQGGTGLGLSISLKIIQDHGGRMDFKSKPTKGTTVSVYLPVKPLKEEEG
jgi:two-component system sensor histidine kinase ChiS